MADDLDHVARFAKSKNFGVQRRTVFLEGRTDVELFVLAAQLERSRTDTDLFGTDLAVVAAGDGDDGGASGVCRELVTFRNMARYCLLPNGRPKYRFIGLFDNDRAGRQAIHDVRKTDTSILEFKDVFRLWPVMPLHKNLDPSALRNSFETENEIYKNMDWELEDLVSETLVSGFLDETPDAIARSTPIHDRVHRDWTSDGKARLHRFIRQNAIPSDLAAVVAVIRAMRHYFNLPLL